MKIQPERLRLIPHGPLGSLAMRLLRALPGSVRGKVAMALLRLGLLKRLDV